MTRDTLHRRCPCDWLDDEVAIAIQCANRLRLSTHTVHQGSWSKYLATIFLPFSWPCWLLARLKQQSTGEIRRSACGILWRQVLTLAPILQSTKKRLRLTKAPNLSFYLKQVSKIENALCALDRERSNGKKKRFWDSNAKWPNWSRFSYTSSGRVHRIFEFRSVGQINSSPSIDRFDHQLLFFTIRPNVKK